MDLQDFIEGFADQFEDTDPEMITADTLFHDLEEWCSLVAMCVIGFVKTSCKKTITNDDLKKAQTVEDLFHIVESK